MTLQLIIPPVFRPKQIVFIGIGSHYSDKTCYMY